MSESIFLSLTKIQPDVSHYCTYTLTVVLYALLISIQRTIAVRSWSHGLVIKGISGFARHKYFERRKFLEYSHKTGECLAADRCVHEFPARLDSPQYGQRIRSALVTAQAHSATQ
jgi:hypothetical protein